MMFRFSEINGTELSANSQTLRSTDLVLITAMVHRGEGGQEGEQEGGVGWRKNGNRGGISMMRNTRVYTEATAHSYLHSLNSRKEAHYYRRRGTAGPKSQAPALPPSNCMS